MKYLRKIKDDIFYIGVSDLRINRFENLFPLEKGMSYNSYLILDEKTCVLDTVDYSVKDEYLKNLVSGLAGRSLDYLVINHLEPDHSAVLEDVLRLYPEVILVMNAKGAEMLNKFLSVPNTHQIRIVKEYDVLYLGKHNLSFIMAPMVHWPEVMVAYDKTDRILFSADAFGNFGALTGNIFNDEMAIDESFYSEARRYYSNIVGKYGQAVQTLFKKTASLDIRIICPLHGPIIRTQVSEFIRRYNLWSSYTSESNEVIFLCASMYNNTYRVCDDIANRLADLGVPNIKIYDVSNADVSYLISEVFRVKNIIIACPNYNGGIYPKMQQLLLDMQALNVSNKNIGIIENGSWAPMISKKIKDIFSNNKTIHFLSSEIKINTVQRDEDEKSILAFIKELCRVIIAK